MAATKNPPRIAAEIRSMKILCNCGHSLPEVGTRFGISPPSVEQIVCRNKI